MAARITDDVVNGDAGNEISLNHQVSLTSTGYALLEFAGLAPMGLTRYTVSSRILATISGIFLYT